MLPLTNRLNKNNFKNKNQSKALKISFIVSFCWHICIFSVVYITLPDMDQRHVNKEIIFLGSYLDPCDFFSAKLSNHERNSYFKIAKHNIFIQDLGDYVKLAAFVEKPKRYFFSQESSLKEERFRTEAQFFPRVEVRKMRLKDEEVSFNSKKLPDMHIYFKEGIPRPVKFNLLICERGRVLFLKKVISSGSFDADMFVQRAIRRLVFDPYACGLRHWRTLELDLKNDSN